MSRNRSPTLALYAIKSGLRGSHRDLDLERLLAPYLGSFCPRGGDKPHLGVCAPPSLGVCAPPSDLERHLDLERIRGVDALGDLGSRLGSGMYTKASSLEGSDLAQSSISPSLTTAASSGLALAQSCP